ncbi:MAG TPA: PAS domain-containing sensor histidine kinase, partial [Methyloceanibacter sp.]|nr:PAS domain-containing sensor histidine kinase [Methyloceanibacter sp.]
MSRSTAIPMPAKSLGSSTPATPKRDAAPPPQRRRLTFVLGFIIVVASLCSGFATYVILTGLSPIIPSRAVVNGVLLINLILVLAMLGIIAWQLTGLWLARRRQAAGAQLHIRIVSLFSVIAIAPAILLGVFASDSLARGLDHWFSVRIKAIIQTSIDVASAYVQEHAQVIRSDTVGMAKDIDEAANLVKTRPEEFGNFLTAQAAIRALPVAYLIDGNGKLLASAATLQDTPYQAPPAKAMELAKKGEAIVIAPGQTNLVGGIKSLENFADTYLYVIRPVNAKVLQYLRETKANVAAYEKLQERRTGVQVAFYLMFTAIALTFV